VTFGLLNRAGLSSCGARVTAWRRAGREVEALSRSRYRTALRERASRRRIPVPSRQRRDGIS
jgi:hypothetical protein